MKVILTENVNALGNVGEIVNVSPGHARNFLLPNNLAVIADEGNKKELEHHQKALAKKVSEQKQVAEGIKSKIEGLSLELIKKVGANGKLFGSVTTNELASELTGKGFTVEKRQLIVDRPIKALGTYTVTAKLFTDVTANFEVKIEADPAQVEEMKRKQAEAKKTKEKLKAKAEAEAAGAEEKATDEAEKLQGEENEVLRS